MNHVIDGLAADVIITRAQTVNVAWNFESGKHGAGELRYRLAGSFHTRRCLQHRCSGLG